jgi:maltodextrin utilization protein YvdJ
VQKVGLSPIDVAEVDFNIPVQWYESNKKITLLELYSPKVMLNIYFIFINSYLNFLLVPMAKWSEAHTVFGFLNTGIMDLNPTCSMDVCPCSFVLCCPVCR